MKLVSKTCDIQHVETHSGIGPSSFTDFDVDSTTGSPFLTALLHPRLSRICIHPGPSAGSKHVAQTQASGELHEWLLGPGSAAIQRRERARRRRPGQGSQEPRARLARAPCAVGVPVDIYRLVLDGTPPRGGNVHCVADVGTEHNGVAAAPRPPLLSCFLYLTAFPAPPFATRAPPRAPLIALLSSRSLSPLSDRSPPFALVSSLRLTHAPPSASRPTRVPLCAPSHGTRQVTARDRSRRRDT